MKYVTFYEIFFEGVYKNLSLSIKMWTQLPITFHLLKYQKNRESNLAWFTLKIPRQWGKKKLLSLYLKMNFGWNWLLSFSAFRFSLLIVCNCLFRSSISIFKCLLCHSWTYSCRSAHTWRSLHLRPTLPSSPSWSYRVSKIFLVDLLSKKLHSKIGLSHVFNKLMEFCSCGNSFSLNISNLYPPILLYIIKKVFLFI